LDQYNYSIIIPHKNTPDLLQRCLDSIPRRVDLQIIVVDDNSDIEKVNFIHFPGLNDPHIEVVFTKEGKGAGYARNVGLKHAKGKWLVFADADDKFNECFNDSMDYYLNSDSDVVYFKATAIKLTDNVVSDRCNELNCAIDEAATSNNIDPLIFSIFNPCCRFYRTELIESNKVKFQEVQYSNDVLFSIKTALSIEKIELSILPIYCISETHDSLTSVNNISAYKTRFDVACQAYDLLKPIKKQHYLEGALYHWWNMLLHINKLYAIYLIPKLFRKVRLLPLLNRFLKIAKNEWPHLWDLLKSIKKNRYWYNERNRYCS
jgi:glycosyltransferase involved in cell wall biosynthesis